MVGKISDGSYVSSALKKDDYMIEYTVQPTTGKLEAEDTKEK